MDQRRTVCVWIGRYPVLQDLLQDGWFLFEKACMSWWFYCIRLRAELCVEEAKSKRASLLEYIVIQQAVES